MSGQSELRGPQFIDLEERDDVIRIAFGSCFSWYDGADTAEIFDVIGRDEPDVFIWLGDAAYIDRYKSGLDPTSVEHALFMF